MDQDEILLDAEDRMDKAVDVFHKQLQGLRTGRATPGLVDSIKVDYYGSPTPLKQIANISVPEPQRIVIRPFDASALSNIAKAIQAGDLGFSPNSDGRLIRLNIPPLSTERRKQLVARVKELAEEARVAIRNIRRDANKHADQAEKDKVLSGQEKEEKGDRSISPVRPNGCFAQKGPVPLFFCRNTKRISLRTNAVQSAECKRRPGLEEAGSSPHGWWSQHTGCGSGRPSLPASRLATDMSTIRCRVRFEALPR